MREEHDNANKRLLCVSKVIYMARFLIFILLYLFKYSSAKLQISNI